MKQACERVGRDAQHLPRMQRRNGKAQKGVIAGHSGIACGKDKNTRIPQITSKAESGIFVTDGDGDNMRLSSCRNAPFMQQAAEKGAVGVETFSFILVPRQTAYEFKTCGGMGFGEGC